MLQYLYDVWKVQNVLRMNGLRGWSGQQTGRSYKEAATGAIFVITLHVIALIMMMVRMEMVMLLMPES